MLLSFFCGVSETVYNFKKYFALNCATSVNFCVRDVQGIKRNKKQRLELELDMCFKIVWSTEIIYAKFGFVVQLNLDT